MFSGLVGAVGTLRALDRRAAGTRIEIDGDLGGEPLAHGESVAVSGVCLTVEAATRQGFWAWLAPETLRRATLGTLRPGDRVNLERSLRLTDRLGGHIVLGHVDATTRVDQVRDTGAFRTARCALPSPLASEVAEKGSVAVDGVSLTVSAVHRDWFEVALVPATLAGTTLASLRAGSIVNLETDVLAKYVRRVLGGRGADLSALLGRPVDAED